MAATLGFHPGVDNSTSETVHSLDLHIFTAAPCALDSDSGPSVMTYPTEGTQGPQGRPAKVARQTWRSWSSRPARQAAPGWAGDAGSTCVLRPRPLLGPSPGYVRGAPRVPREAPSSAPRAGSAPRVVPPCGEGGGAARQAAARRPRPRPAGGGPAPRSTCGKERAGRAREGLRGGGRGVRPATRSHWLQRSGAGPARPAIGRRTRVFAYGLGAGRGRGAAGARGGHGRCRSWAVSWRRPRAGVAGDARRVSGQRAGVHPKGPPAPRTVGARKPKLEGREASECGSTPPPARWSLQAQGSHCPPHTALLRTHCACDSG